MLLSLKLKTFDTSWNERHLNSEPFALLDHETNIRYSVFFHISGGSGSNGPGPCQSFGRKLAADLPTFCLSRYGRHYTQCTPSIKILNSSHFSCGYQSDNGEEVLAGGGRYTLEKDTLYTEFLEYHTSEALIGIELRFSPHVVGDLWYHVGEFPSGFRLEEVWRRIE